MNDPSIIVAIFSLIGTVTGSIAGILVSNKLINYRIEQLEQKLDKYVNNADAMRERLVIVEQSTKQAHHRLDDITQQLQIKERRKDE